MTHEPLTASLRARFSVTCVALCVALALSACAGDDDPPAADLGPSDAGSDLGPRDAAAVADAAACPVTCSNDDGCCPVACGPATDNDCAAPPAGVYPFQGYTDTRGAFEATIDGAAEPRILVVDRLTASDTDGDEATGRGSLSWALAQRYPRVVLFEISGVITIGGDLNIASPYVSVHGQTAPSPGITLYDVSLTVSTHDVILQHLRVRMGETMRGGGDPMGVCGTADGATHDIIIDHCSSALGHDEQLSISSCGDGDVRRVTLSNNIVSLGLNYADHAFGTLIDSGGSNAYDVDEILVEGNLFSDVSFRTPLVNFAARHVTITNNVTYNTQWVGMQVETDGYPEGQFVDVMHNLYWRGPETENAGTWPTPEVATWPAQPDLWPPSWNRDRRPVSAFRGPAGSNTHVYYANNYDYANNEDYGGGNHEGRPVELQYERYLGAMSFADIHATSRQTSPAIVLLTPREVEARVDDHVGCTAADRDPVDLLAVRDAVNRTGTYLDHVADLVARGAAATATGSDSRSLASIAGYPVDTELADTDGDGLTDLEGWLYNL